MPIPEFQAFMLDKPGHANTAERLALMERLLADREFVGEAWFRWRQHHHIPFPQRLKRNRLAPNRRHQMRRLERLFASLKPGECRHLPGRRPVWGCFVHRSALRLDDGALLFIARSVAPQTEAIAADADAGRSRPSSAA